MTDLADAVGRKYERDSARYERENRRLVGHAGSSGPNASADAAASMVLDRRFEAAREAVRDAKHELAQLRREHAHPADIAEAREVLADARADLDGLR